MTVNVKKGSFEYLSKQINYYESGDKINGNTVLLIHGTGGNTDKHFSYLFPMLSFKHHVVSIDLETDLNQEVTLSYYIDQIKKLISLMTESDEKISVVGYSLGAVIAAALSAEIKSKVSNLILIAGWAKTSSVQRLRNKIWKNLYLNQSEALSNFTNYCLYSDDYLSLRSDDQLDKLSKLVNPTEITLLQRNLIDTIDLTYLLKDITAETLIISCKKDKMIPKKETMVLFAGIENSRYTEINSGHACYIEAPAEVIHLVSGFILHQHRYPQNKIIEQISP